MKFLVSIDNNKKLMKINKKLIILVDIVIIQLISIRAVILINLGITKYKSEILIPIAIVKQAPKIHIFL
ncbi:hypothetical protein [Clostridium chauvoei]|uniref:hypothetical protein n=2 Tax=Clostridium chauvoei TaxID=46867 RepID=UPI001C862ACF|nr:hypothetical protein [Clostridium chauvoei]MBX7305567.1 hypothetical protein [Clostridium chauvoei]